MSAETTGVINEGDESGLKGLAIDLEVRPKEGVALPHVIGVRLGESQAMLVGALIIGLKHLVLFDNASESIGSDLRTSEPAFFQTKSINGRE